MCTNVIEKQRKKSVLLCGYGCSPDIIPRGDPKDQMDAMGGSRMACKRHGIKPRNEMETWQEEETSKTSAPQAQMARPCAAKPISILTFGRPYRYCSELSITLYSIGILFKRAFFFFKFFSYLIVSIT